MVQLLRALAVLGEDRGSVFSIPIETHSCRGPCVLFWHLGTPHACAAHKLTHVHIKINENEKCTSKVYYFFSVVPFLCFGKTSVGSQDLRQGELVLILTSSASPYS